MPIAPKRIALRITPEVMTPFTLAIVPGLPIMALISIYLIMMANTQNSTVSLVSSVTTRG